MKSCANSLVQAIKTMHFIQVPYTCCNLGVAKITSSQPIINVNKWLQLHRIKQYQQFYKLDPINKKMRF